MSHKVGFFKKIYLFFVARKDVQGAFGQEVKDYYAARKDKKLLETMPYPISAFMQYQVRLYLSECSKKANAFFDTNPKSKFSFFSIEIPENCRKILELEDKISKNNAESVQKIDTLNLQINAFIEELEKKKKYQTQANLNAKIEADMLSDSLVGLNLAIKELKSELEGLEQEKKSEQDRFSKE